MENNYLDLFVNSFGKIQSIKIHKKYIMCWYYSENPQGDGGTKEITIHTPNIIFGLYSVPMWEPRKDNEFDQTTGKELINAFDYNLEQLMGID